MTNTKDLREIFDELTKRAGDAIGDAKVPTFGRDPTPGLLYFGIGLAFGAIAGMLIAFLATPYNGEQARRKVAEQVERVRKQREEMRTNGGGTYAAPTTGAYERTG